MKRIALLALGALTGFALISGCAAESQTVEGEITAVGEESVTVKTDSGEERTFTVDDETEYVMDDDASGESPGQSAMAAGEAPPKPEGDAPAEGAPDGSQASSEKAPGTPQASPNEAGAGPADTSEASGGPEAPSEGGGAAGNGDARGQEPPAKPEGEAPAKPEGEQPPDAQGAPSLREGMEVIVDIEADDVASRVIITSLGAGMPGAGAQAPTSYEAAYAYDTDDSVEGEALESTGSDENTVLVDGAEAQVSLVDDAVTRLSSDSTGGDQASFYGVGAALLVTEGELEVQDCDIATDASGGAGVFAYGNGKARVSDTAITTAQDASGGLHVAGGGTLEAENVTVVTAGESSAAIRSDRGSGKMTVVGGSFTSNGKGSPAIYSTADITVSDADLAATGSEAVCIEGLNSVKLKDCDLSGNQPDDDRNEVLWNVILYQSMSGDAEEGNAVFTMDGGKLIAERGGMFYTTNTESTFVLKDVDLVYSEDSPFLLRCAGNENRRGWGRAGENGADCSFTAIDQELEGDIQWDSISTLDMYLTDGSTLKGAFVREDNGAGGKAAGRASLSVSQDSQWIVTQDSFLTSLACAGPIVDGDGNRVAVKDSAGNLLAEGTSPYTVTVDSYSTTPDFTEAGSLD